MYPHPELKRLVAQKAALRRLIAGQRARSAAAALRVVQPLRWLDRAVALARQCSPFLGVAALPLAWLAVRSRVARGGKLGALLRWAPLVFGAARHFAGTRARPPRG